MKKLLFGVSALVFVIVAAIVLLSDRVPTLFGTVIPTAKAEAARSSFRFKPPKETRDLSKVRFVNEGGQAMTLADFRGRVVLLNIWATWCLPCREEMGSLDRLQAAFGGAEFEVLPLSVDDQGLPAVMDFYRELGLEELPVYVDESGEVLRALRVVGMPTTLLIDRSGGEIGRKVGPAEWDSKEVLKAIRGHLGNSR